jgi:hypothetical protein
MLSDEASAGRPNIVVVSWAAPLGLYRPSPILYYRRVAPLGLKNGRLPKAYYRKRALLPIQNRCKNSINAARVEQVIVFIWNDSK